MPRDSNMSQIARSSSVSGSRSGNAAKISPVVMNPRSRTWSSTPMAARRCDVVAGCSLRSVLRAQPFRSSSPRASCCSANSVIHVTNCSAAASAACQCSSARAFASASSSDLTSEARGSLSLTIDPCNRLLDASTNITTTRTTRSSAATPSSGSSTASRCSSEATSGGACCEAFVPGPARRARRTQNARADRRTGSTWRRPLMSSGACTAQRSASSSRRSTSAATDGCARRAGSVCGRAIVLLTRVAQPIGRDVEPVGEPHHVLVAHELVRDARRSSRPRARPRRARPSNVERSAAASSRSIRNSRNGVAPLTALTNACGSSRHTSAGIAARLEVGDLELHLVPLLPLVAAFGRGLSRVVGVVREHDLAREVLQREEVVVGERRAARRDRVRAHPRARTPSRRCSPRRSRPRRARRSRPSPSGGRTATATSGRAASRRCSCTSGPCPSSVRPPKPTGSPLASQIGNISRPRNESCSRLALFTNARPAVTMSSRANLCCCRCTLSASNPSGDQPNENFRAASPSKPRLRR